MLNFFPKRSPSFSSSMATCVTFSPPSVVNTRSAPVLGSMYLNNSWYTLMRMAIIDNILQEQLVNSYMDGDPCRSMCGDCFVVPNHLNSIISTLLRRQHLSSGHICHCSLSLEISVDEVAHEVSASEIIEWTLAVEDVYM